MGKRVEKKLDARTVATLKKPGRHSDGGGLYLSIDGKGRRRWIFMYVRNGKRTELGLGSGRDLPLADAREVARGMRTVLAKGGDPRAERRKAHAAMTFGDCADEYVKTMKPSWSNEKHASQWKMTLTEYAAPIRDLMVHAVDTPHILDVLRPLWQSKPETASRLRGRIERVLDSAKAKGLRSGENPARWRGHLDQLLPKRKRLSRGHHKALPFGDLSEFVKLLRAREATAALALEFTILTAARTGEVLGARWEEMDLEAGVWTIPAIRMKAGKEHRVPLSERAKAILEAVKAIRDGDLVFPGPKPKSSLSSMAMSMLLRRMKVDATVHGFRSTFRDWAAETSSFPHEVCEMALAHVIANKAEAAYRRGDLFDKRRKLMDAWAAFCEVQQEGKVVPLRAENA